MGPALFTTPATGEPETATGPLVMAGISLFEVSGKDRVAAFYDDVELFNVNAAGAALLMLADGVRSLEQITADAVSQGHAAELADVALFFSSLGQAGYLRNRVLVSMRG